MPKMKTHQATKKRFKITATGKILRHKKGKSHNRRKKAKRVKRMFDRMIEVETPGEKKRIRRLLPYMNKYN